MDRRDPIGQAEDIPMERHRLTAAQAFELPVRASSHPTARCSSWLTGTGTMPTG